MPFTGNVRDVSKIVSRALTQPIDSHDSNLTGVTPKKPAQPIPAPTGSALSVFWRVTKAQPKHFVENWINAIPAFIVAFLSFLWYANILNTYKAEIAPPSAESARMLFYAYPSPSRIRAPAFHGWFLQNSGLLLVLLVIELWNIVWALSACHMWKRSVVLSYLKRGWLIYFLCAYIVAVCTIPVIYTNSTRDFENVLAYLWLFFFVMFTGFLIQTIAMFFLIGIASNNLPWATTSGIYCLSTGVQVIVYDILFASVLLQLGSLPKAAFVVILHPIWSEFGGTLARLASRSLRHNHPTTSFHVISYSVCLKKVYSRLVIMTLPSDWVSIISIVLALLELTLRVTMPYRDRYMYRKLFGPHLEGQNPYKLMTDARNRTLRAETESIENVTDFVYIFSNVVWPWMAGISFNGKTPATVEALARSAATQFLIECTLDVLVAYTIAFLQNYFTFMHAKTKTSYWGLIVATHVLAPAVTLMIMVLPYALCASYDTAFEWGVCTSD